MDEEQMKSGGAIDDEASHGLSRRSLITRAGAGAAMVWVAPVVTRVGLVSAAASHEPEPDTFVLSTPQGGPPRVQYIAGFLRADPTTFLTNVPITGLSVNADGVSVLKSIDFRRRNGTLFGLARQAGGTQVMPKPAELYIIDPVTGVASLQGVLSFTLGMGEQVGIDFQPTTPIMRVVTTTGKNLRVDSNTLVVTTDTQLTRPVPGAPEVAGAAYTKSVPNATVLYVIDSQVNGLATVTPPSSGVLTFVGPTGTDPKAFNGFDIIASGGVDFAFTVYRNAANVPTFYSVSLGTGTSAPLGTLGTTNQGGGPAFDNVQGLALRR